MHSSFVRCTQVRHVEPANTTVALHPQEPKAQAQNTITMQSHVSPASQSADLTFTVYDATPCHEQQI